MGLGTCSSLNECEYFLRSIQFFNDRHNENDVSLRTMKIFLKVRHIGRYVSM